MIEYLTPPEVAKLLRVRIDKVRNWIRNGDLAASNVAESPDRKPRYRVSRDDLQAFLDRRKVPKPALYQPRRRRVESAPIVNRY